MYSPLACPPNCVSDVRDDDGRFTLVLLRSVGAVARDGDSCWTLFIKLYERAARCARRCRERERQTGLWMSTSYSVTGALPSTGDYLSLLALPPSPSFYSKRPSSSSSLPSSTTSATMDATTTPPSTQSPVAHPSVVFGTHGHQVLSAVAQLFGASRSASSATVLMLVSRLQRAQCSRFVSPGVYSGATIPLLGQCASDYNLLVFGAICSSLSSLKYVHYGDLHRFLVLRLFLYAFSFPRSQSPLTHHRLSQLACWSAV